MLLSPLAGVRAGLVSALGGTTANTVEPSQRQDASIRVHGGEASPWRVLVIGDKPGGFAWSGIIFIGSESSVRAGRHFMDQAGQGDAGHRPDASNSKAIIDFAATGGLQYVCLDDRWYGFGGS